MTDVAETFTPDRLAPLADAARALLFTDARTANSFADTPVTDEELTAIWDLAQWPPTMANTQPLRVLYVRTPEGKARLVEHMADGNKAKTASAPVVAVLAWDSRFHENIPQLLPFRPEMKDYFEADEAARNAGGTYSAALQAGYFILAIRAAGLVAGPMGGFDRDGIDAEFFGDSTWRSQLVVNIGHAGENAWFERLPRLDHDAVVQWA